MSEVEFCKTTSCSFSSLIEAGEASIIWRPVLPLTGHWALFQNYLQSFPISLSLSHLPLFPLSLLHSLILSYSPSSPLPLPAAVPLLSCLFPPLFLTLSFSSLCPFLPLVSSPHCPRHLSLPSPPTLTLSVIIDTIIRTKGQHLGSDLRTAGSKRKLLCSFFLDKACHDSILFTLAPLWTSSAQR